MKKIMALVLAVVLCTACVLSFASCNQEKAYNIPIVCGETGMNDICGIATYGVNYYNLGVKAGDMAADILLGEFNPATMTVQTDPNPALTISTSVASDIGFTIPESVSSRAGEDATLSITRVESAVIAEDSDTDADFTVGILQLMQHVALDACNTGFIDELSVRMNEYGKTVKILNKNASGDASNNATIASNFVAQNVDLIYAIATSSAQACAEATAENKTPVIFCAVTDPVTAGLVESMDVPGGNVTGVSDINPVADQVDLIGELLGKDNVKIGFLYTSAEINSVFQIKLGIAECEKKGYEYVDMGIGDLNDVQSAFVALKAAGVDAIYIPTDNVLANAASTVHSINIGE